MENKEAKDYVNLNEKYENNPKKKLAESQEILHGNNEPDSSRKLLVELDEKELAKIPKKEQEACNL
jgi:hypothetical protein